MEVVNIKPFVNNKEAWNSFEAEIERQLLLNYQYLSSVKDVNEIMRYQGRIAVLQEMLTLRDRVNG